MEHIIAKLLQDFEHGKMSRRQLIRGMAVAAAAASTVAGAQSAKAAGSPIKAVGIHHITWDVKNHAKLRDFYADLFGIRVFEGNIKTESHLQIGNTYLTFSGPGTRNKPASLPTTVVNHIAIAVEPWPGTNKDDVSGSPVVVAELKRRGLPLIPLFPGFTRTQDKGEVRISDPEGFPVQICGANWHTDG